MWHITRSSLGNFICERILQSFLGPGPVLKRLQNADQIRSTSFSPDVRTATFSDLEGGRPMQAIHYCLMQVVDARSPVKGKVLPGKSVNLNKIQVLPSRQDHGKTIPEFNSVYYH